MFMRDVLNFVIRFVTDNNQDVHKINVTGLVIALSIILLSLVICIAVTKKNRLYIKPNTNDKEGTILQEKEVAS